MDLLSMNFKMHDLELEINSTGNELRSFILGQLSHSVPIPSITICTNTQ